MMSDNYSFIKVQYTYFNNDAIQKKLLESIIQNGFIIIAGFIRIILNRMKNNNNYFQTQIPQEQEFNPEDILKAFKQLTQQSKPKQHSFIDNSYQAKKQSIDPVQISKSKQQPLKNSSIKVAQSQNFPKKTYIIKKPAHRQDRVKLNHENSLSRFSNESKQHQMLQQNQKKQQQINKNIATVFPKFTDNSIIQDRQKINQKIKQQIKSLQQLYHLRNQQYYQEKQTQKQVCRKILNMSFKKKLQYSIYLQTHNKVREQIIKEEISDKYETEIKFLQNEDSKVKLRKNKKTQNMSDQDETKTSQMMTRQKRQYLSLIQSKISKQKEKYGVLKLGQNQLKISPIKQEKLKQLHRHASLSNYQFLCSIQGSNSQVQQIHCMDVQKLQEGIIICLKYNPTIHRNHRLSIFQQFKEISVKAKKFTASSTNIFFPFKSILFMPIVDIISSQDEVLIINQKLQNLTPLHKFLARIEYTGGDHNISLLKYLIKVCLKAVEQIGQHSTHISAVILPSSIYVNQKFEFKFRNIIFNEIIFKQFRHLLDQEEYFFFPPEEKPEPSSITLWSVGILTYSLYFNSKPFPKYQPYSWPSRQYFLALNQLQIPHKNSMVDKTKQFILNCLTRKANTQNLVQLCGDLFNNSNCK